MPLITREVSVTAADIDTAGENTGYNTSPVGIALIRAFADRGYLSVNEECLTESPHDTYWLIEHNEVDGPEGEEIEKKPFPLLLSVEDTHAFNAAMHAFWDGEPQTPFTFTAGVKENSTW